MQENNTGQDYERFVRQVLQDFDDRVFAVQKRADESVRGKNMVFEAAP